MFQVNFFTVSNLRNSTLSEVRAIKELFYTHGKDISIFVEVLAETMHLVQAKEKDVDKLKINFRTIVKRATGLVSDLMAIIERIERHSASFQYKIEKAVQIVSIVVINFSSWGNVHIDYKTADESGIIEFKNLYF